MGHVRLLTEASKLGDRLLVLINDDASVRRLKGDNRPINPLAYRMEMLRALRCVYDVMPFTADTPEYELSLLRPEVLVKGAEYVGKTVPGSQYAQRVVFIPMSVPVSTTSILAQGRTEREKDESK